MSFFSALEFKRASSIKRQERLQEEAKRRRADVAFKKKKHSKEARFHYNQERMLAMCD